MSVEPDDMDLADLAVLAALDALDDDELIGLDPIAVDAAADFAAVIAELAGAAADEPPADLRANVLDAARAARPPGRPTPEVAAMTAAEAYERTVDGLEEMLRALATEEWLADVRPVHGRVRDLVAHLAGVEELSAGWLSGESGDGEEHVLATRPVMDALAEAPIEDVVQRWRRGADEVVRRARAADPHQPLTVYGIPTDLDGLFVLRTFEVWAHAHDIAEATGRDEIMMDGPRLSLMSQRLMAALPMAVNLRGEPPADSTVRIVLTGSGGGTYDIPLTLGEEPAEPTATIVADVADFCMLAADRIDPADLRATVEGDRRAADLVLASASAFARD